MKSSFLKGLLRSPVIGFLILLGAISVLTALGPAEKSLGIHVRVVYLHGAWVWAALANFLAAAVVGLSGLILRKPSLHQWSRALGRTGLFFWITYLPISIWAMQSNWNGLFLAEPRWRLALIFAISGLLAQVGVSLLENPAWASGTNIVFVAALFLTLHNTQNLMHPPAPILNSDALRMHASRIQLYFVALLGLTLLASWQVVRWWRRFERGPAKKFHIKISPTRQEL
jgi:hypothetical protein